MQYTFKTYRKRPIRYLGNEAFGNWILKQYSISHCNEYVPSGLFEAAKKFVVDLLPGRAVTDTRHGVGFMIVHEGADGNYLLVSWWEGENMLCQYVLGSDLNEPFHFTTLSNRAIIACVWELEVIYFEKRSWSNAVLMNEGPPDFNKYLCAGFSGEI